MNASQAELLQDAEESLAAARLLLENLYLGYAASRAYFAMFYAGLRQCQKQRGKGQMGDSRIELFNRWAENYDDSTRHSGAFPFTGRDRVLNRVVSLAQVRSGMQVLDIGTGTGDLAARFVHLNCAVWGLDFSASMLAVARRKVPGASFVQADLRSHLPLDLQRRFDRIVSTYVLHEFTLSEKVDLLYTLLREYVVDGGRIVIGDVAFLSAEDREAAHRKWPDLWDEHEHYWAADETLAACTNHRLRIRYEQVSICGGVFVLARDDSKPIDLVI